jgi:hypothetical protein
MLPGVLPFIGLAAPSCGGDNNPTGTAGAMTGRLAHPSRLADADGVPGRRCPPGVDPMIRYTCRACHTPLEFPDADACKEVPCPHCREPLEVPAARHSRNDSAPLEVPLSEPVPDSGNGRPPQTAKIVLVPLTVGPWILFVLFFALGASLAKGPGQSAFGGLACFVLISGVGASLFVRRGIVSACPGCARWFAQVLSKRQLADQKREDHYECKFCRHQWAIRSVEDQDKLDAD